MANITRYSPFSNLERFALPKPKMRRRLSAHPRGGELLLPCDIALDLAEIDKTCARNADLPGLSKDDTHVLVNGNRVSISAEVKKEEGKNMIRCGRSSVVRRHSLRRSSP